jgi:hypothetical protein
MRKLLLHPDCPPGPPGGLPDQIEQIEADIVATPDGCCATFLAYGDIGRIVVPERVRSERANDLWRTTCFEIFWQPEGGTYYREFNLSPSTRWACYDFDDVRQGFRDAPAIVTVHCERSATRLMVKADIQSDLPCPARVALTAIIDPGVDAGNGQNRFYALAFPEGAPEFHSAICRTISVT